MFDIVEGGVWVYYVDCLVQVFVGDVEQFLCLVVDGVDLVYFVVVVEIVVFDYCDVDVDDIVVVEDLLC